jgi:putative oxidoreductase
MKLGRLLLRATVGGFFVGHGTQKLFGWFGGNGLEATAGGFEKLGLHPPKAQAALAGAAEAGGGLGLVAGVATPLSSAVLVATMLTAINRVHFKNGPWLNKGGYEYNAVLIAAALIIAELGPGKLSVDAAVGRERSGTGVALAVAAAGVLGAVGAHLASEALAPAPEPEPTPAPVEADVTATVQEPATKEA